MTALRGIGFAGLLVLTAMSARADWVNKDKKDVLGRPDSLGHHLVDGISGVTEFQLTAKEGHISTPEGNSVYVWGFASGTGPLQYPGPTLIVNQGESIKVTLKNQLPFPVSIVFPGQSGIVSSGGAGPGVIAQEATVGNDVIYTFTAKKPGTYLYNSGTRPDLQTEMGLVGSLIVRPGAASGKAFNATDPSTWTAYGTPDSAFDQEFLFMLTDMDPDIHDNTERLMLAWHAAGGTGSYSPAVDTTHHNANYWFINGRCGPDTMMQAGSGALPAQPYDAFPMMHPGQRLMMRVIGGGRDPHPFHHHGNHAMVIARNGRLLQSSPAAGYSDLAYRVFTTPAYPGETSDGVFTWTGQGLGWDVYGHTGNEDVARDANGLPLEKTIAEGGDHLKPFPVLLPTEQDMEFGLFYSGSPFLGFAASTPPNTGGFDLSGGYVYMWHSHAEREIVNNNVFPGGMLTMLLIQPW